MDLEIIKNVYNEYANTFDMNNYDVSYKYKHSYRVMALSKKLAIELGLNDEDVALATTIGLLHDIGRFKQLEMFANYDDSNIDHADLGVKILFEDNLIEKFNIDKKYYEIIKFAIKNHNKLDIEKTDNENMLMHAKIIRDTDKIDILRAFTLLKDYKFKECDEDITKEVSDSFYNQESVKKNERNNLNDKIILIFSYVYDINFKASLDLIKKDKIYENLYESIEHKEIFKPYFNYIMNYLKKEIE